MSLDHKAFIFDSDYFVDELANILENAILTNHDYELIIFIENNLPYLKHPDEGDNLNSAWKEEIEIGDISEYGDFAITKYYNPKENIGMGGGWMQFDDLLSQQLNIDTSCFLGTRFGCSENYFDPGKQGSYFQSLEQVKQNLKLLTFLPKIELDNQPNIYNFVKMFENALDVQQGLYITF